jgi:hypothetical protein
MSILAENYYWGRGVKQDRDEAFKWFKKAAELGEVRAEVSLAMFYYSRSEAERPLAVMWLNRAANRWCFQAQYFLAYCYGKGDGVTKVVVESYKWAILSSDKGYKYSTALCSVINDKEHLNSDQIAEAIRRADEFIKTNTFSPPIEQWPDVINLEPINGAGNSKPNLPSR